MDMIFSGKTKHHYHQAVINRVKTDETPLRVWLAGIFTHQKPAVKHQLSRQQGQTPLTDIGGILGRVAGKFHRTHYTYMNMYLTAHHYPP